jgi:hypothetical protein
MKLKFVEYESETKQALLEEYDENGWCLFKCR